MKFEEFPEYLTISDVTAILHVHANTLRNWEKVGLIKPARIGPRKDRRYPKQSIKDLLANA